jgi:hypothetical protein
MNSGSKQLQKIGKEKGKRQSEKLNKEVIQLPIIMSKISRAGAGLGQMRQHFMSERILCEREHTLFNPETRRRVGHSCNPATTSNGLVAAMMLVL